jgi:hypothetical protein
MSYTIYLIVLWCLERVVVCGTACCPRRENKSKPAVATAHPGKAAGGFGRNGTPWYRSCPLKDLDELLV